MPSRTNERTNGAYIIDPSIFNRGPIKLIRIIKNNKDKIQKTKSTFCRLNFSQTEIRLYFYCYFWLIMTRKNYNFCARFFKFCSFWTTTTIQKFKIVLKSVTYPTQPPHPFYFIVIVFFILNKKEIQKFCFSKSHTSYHLPQFFLKCLFSLKIHYFCVFEIKKK